MLGRRGSSRLYRVGFLVVALWAIGLAQTDAQLCAKANEAGYWQGLEGWLFSEADLRTNFPVLAEEVERLGEAFQKQGIPVVFVAVPPRAVLAYNHLDRAIEPFSSYPREDALEAYRTFLSVFADSGFTTLDLSTFDDTFFFKTDHHWSPAGAKVAAQ